MLYKIAKVLIINNKEIRKNLSLLFNINSFAIIKCELK